MERLITIHCGEHVTQMCGHALHPVQSVMYAKRIIDSPNGINVYYSNDFDFISTILHYGETKGVKVIFYLNEELVHHDEVFGDLNRSMDLLNKIIDENLT